MDDFAPRLLVGARSETGSRRRNNQDSGFAGSSLLLIADGVGGAPAGDRASALIVRGLVETLPGPAQRTETVLRDALARANSRLSAAGRDDPEVSGMATTLTGLATTRTGAFMLHVGDSRAYRLRDGRFEQLTADQSWVQLLIEQGLLPPEDALRHPMRHLLMHSLSGALGDPDAAQIVPVDLRPDDRWVLVTDGLSDYLPTGVLTALVSSTPDPQELADALVTEAWPVSKDNISAVVADVTAGESVAGGSFIGAAATPIPDPAQQRSDRVG